MHPEAPTNTNSLYNHALNSFVLTKADMPTRWLLYFSFPNFTKECCLGIRQRPPPPVSGFCFFLFYEDEHFSIIINNIKTLYKLCPVCFTKTNTICCTKTVQTVHTLYIQCELLSSYSAMKSCKCKLKNKHHIK